MSAAIALLLLLGSGAKADVIETFKLSGSFKIPSPVTFSGTVVLDFTNDFASDTFKSIAITVAGRPVFNHATSSSPYFALSGEPAVVDASNSLGDTLVLMFTTPDANTFASFDKGAIAGGQVIFGGVTGFLFGPTGFVTRDPSDPPIIIDPPIIDPPDPPSAPVPELSTWTMMLIGLAGLGLAAKGRRALALRGRRA